MAAETESLSNAYDAKLSNMSAIRNNLESLLTELDNHDQVLSKGFSDIQDLIDKQRKKFENLSNDFNEAQENHKKKKKKKASPDNNKTDNDGQDEKGDNDDNNNTNDGDDGDEDDFTLIDIKLDPLPPIPQMDDIELPPKREPIEIIPFERMDIDFDFLNKQIEIAHTQQLKPEDDEQYDDQKLTEDEEEEKEEEPLSPVSPTADSTDVETETEDEEEVPEEEEEELDEAMIAKLEEEKTQNLLQMDMPKEVKKVLGDKKKWKMPKKKKAKAAMERDLRKITEAIKDLDDDQRKYAKLSILKYYDILFETFKKYCKIGGDKDWLTQKGWISLYKDAFIPDKKSDSCTDGQCKALFQTIYDSHHANSKKSASSKHNKAMMTTALVLSEWNDDDPWSGTWKQDTSESGGAAEIYKIKQVGDKKLVGFIKSFEFCDINGSIAVANRIKSQVMIFWHEGARKGKRRICKCTLNQPQKITDPVTMTVDWKSVAASSNVNTGTAEEGQYTMTKVEGLSDDDNNLFKFTIGLARHEYFDAMLVLSKMKYPELAEKRYEALCKLCEECLIPYIWGGMEKAKEATIKSIFRPHSTELHKLFAKYNSIDSSDGSDDSLLGFDEWKVLCQDILKQDKNAFKSGGKPAKEDIVASFELAKEGYDLELTYKGYETALKNLAGKMYKKKPKQKYAKMEYNDKLKKLLKWAVKLQKSGYQPTLSKK